MASKQESISDYYEMAKEIAKIEKALGIEQWDLVSITRDGEKAGEYISLYHYNVPRQIAEKYEWVIRWRAARLQCQYPRRCVTISHSLYKKVMGEDIGMQKDIDTFVAAKAQLTRQERIVNQYVEQKRLENDMFYNELEDSELVKAKAKLQVKREQVEQAERRLIEKVKQYKILSKQSV